MMQNGSLIKSHNKFLQQQIDDNKGMIAYCDQKINSDIAAWEKKEYTSVKNAAIKSLAKAEENMANLENYA